MTLLRSRLVPWGCVLAVLFAGSPAANLAFSYVAEGEPLPPLELDRSGGGRESYVGAAGDLARVFAFVKGDHPHSAEIIAEMAAIAREFGDRPVHWALIVSDRHGAAWADSAAAALPGVSVLIDHGDTLYGTLGVALTPAVGLGTAEGVLHAYLPYRKIHFGAVLRAHLQFLLGDIDAAGLAEILEPVRSRVADSQEAGCLRALKLAGMLTRSGKTDKALIQIENALADCPELPDAYQALAEVRKLQGDEAGAEAAAMRALSLDRVR
ncbi:MAG: tetratricopeptide repeat protein [Candidatus Krumholzibacteriia bacterium]